MSVAPTTELELGRNLKPDSIVEGNDVYFECRIRCNPPPHRILWTHEVSGWILPRFSFAYSSRWLLFFIGAPIKTRLDPLELLVAGGKRKTWKIGADIRMKRFCCHSKEIGILFLLFSSAEPQKDLVIIRIESLLLRVQQTTEMFFFPLFYYLLVGFWLG